MTNRQQLEALLERLVGDDQATAVAGVVEWGRGRTLEAYAGWLDPASRAVPVEATTLFDLASLTKPLTATLAFVLHESGELPMETPLGSIWESAAAALREITLEDLLTHRAGLRRWMPLYEVCVEPGEVMSRLLDGQWLDAPSGTYSDLDYILWTLSAERALGASYRDLLSDRVLLILAAAEFSFGDGSERAARCLLPTGREVDLAAAVGLQIAEQPPPAIGQPQDGNSRFLGRSLGHAGVFATARGVSALARLYLTPGSLLSPEGVERALAGSGRYGVGWFRQPETAGGRAFDSSAFGHEGFTGGSVWIDPSAGVTAVLLAHRSSLEVDLGEARARLHRLALAAAAAERGRTAI